MGPAIIKEMMLGTGQEKALCASPALPKVVNFGFFLF